MHYIDKMTLVEAVDVLMKVKNEQYEFRKRNPSYLIGGKVYALSIAIRILGSMAKKNARKKQEMNKNPLNMATTNL